MSWCGGGEIRPTPGVEWRTAAICWSTLWPGSWPPSPGFAPCAILICSSSALTRYSVVTPKRPDATCLIAERIESPLGKGAKRSRSSPPSPVFDLPPMRFMAMASVVCASRLIEPKRFAADAPGISAADVDAIVARSVGLRVAPRRLGRDLVQPDALDHRRGAGEIFLDQLARQADRIEDLCAAVGLERRDAHLGHHLH